MSDAENITITEEDADGLWQKGIFVNGIHKGHTFESKVTRTELVITCSCGRSCKLAHHNSYYNSDDVIGSTTLIELLD